MISYEEATWLIRCILNREPNGEEEIRWCMKGFADRNAARIAFVWSRAFQEQFFPVAPYIPEQALAYTKPNTRRVVLGAIVKDEEQVIERMLRSCIPLIDHAVIIDTGSTDRTLEIVRDVMAEANISSTVHCIDFINFAHARNQIIACLPPGMDWLLMLDADEHLVPEDYHKFEALLSENCPGWRLPRYNFHDIEKRLFPSPYPDYQGRLINLALNPSISFAGAVHEGIQGNFQWRAAPSSDAYYGGPTGGVHIHHMGIVVNDAQRAKKKQELYQKLAE